jgi:hypothetical protein
VRSDGRTFGLNGVRVARLARGDSREQEHTRNERGANHLAAGGRSQGFSALLSNASTSSK